MRVLQKATVLECNDQHDAYFLCHTCTESCYAKVKQLQFLTHATGYQHKGGGKK